MSIFTLQSVRKDFGIKTLLKDATFSLGSQDKVGLIGTNGSGKSTLLKLIAGMEPIDSGELWVNPNAHVVYLPQQPQIDADSTVLEQVFADSGERIQLVREYEDLSHRMAQAEGEQLDRLMARLAKVNERMEATQAWELETQAKIILSKLGIQNFEARVGDLSGGYRKRIALASALISEPDVLLMDEPTNHLDALSVEWMQEYLTQFRGALLLITHDRYFLDQVTNQIIEIDRGDLYTYAGNYSYFLGKKAESEEIEVSRQRKHRGVLRREYEWLKQGPKARSTKQRARIDRIEEMKNQEFKQALGKVEISTVGRRIGKKVIEVENISKSYHGRVLIKDFSYEFSPEDRVGIIGPNGVGKSTLMNLITGQLEPDTGRVEIGTTIHIGYFNQHSDELQSAMDQNQRVIDYLKEEGEFVQTSDGSRISASQMLERFLFPPDHQYIPIHKLSGGEKRRLFLLRVLMSAPNVLILDEPTNDLDVQTLSVLEEYLEEFNGTVIVVSHDRYFLDRTVKTLFVFGENGSLRNYPGNYSTYLDFKRAEELAAAESQPAKSQSQSVRSEKKTEIQSQQTGSRSNTHANKPRKMSFKEKREFEHLETQIPEMETQKATLEQKLYTSPPSDYQELQQLSEQLAQLEIDIDQATERWLELSELPTF